MQEPTRISAASSACMAAWTARQLANKLCLSKQAVRKELAGVRPVADDKQVRGQEALAWGWESLPERYQTALAALARRKGYATPQGYLNDAEDCAWRPAVAFAELPETARAEAEQWREVLFPMLTRQHDFSPGDLWKSGLDSCRRVFGREVSEDTLRRRFDTARERDRNFEDWTRPDLYVSAEAYTRDTLPACASSLLAWQAELAAQFGQFKTPGRLSRLERFDAFRLMFPLAEAVPAAELCRFAFERLPGLSRRLRSATRNFTRCLAEWKRRGCQDAAARPEKPPGRPKQKLCEPCAEKMKGAARDLGGNMAGAWRRLYTSPELGGIRAGGKGFCDECVSKWDYDVRKRRKYVPKAVIEQCRPDVLSALPWTRGPKTAHKLSPYTPGNPNDIGPGDVFEADDVTFNHEFYLWEPGQDGRPYVGRGECLMFIDRRTKYPLGYRLICGKADAEGRQQSARYTGYDIRMGVLHIHDKQGLPHGKLLFENSIWASRLVSGVREAGFGDVDFRDYEQGLNEAGILIGGGVAHALPGNPRRKLIERVFRDVQEQMRYLPGYVGGNHREYNPEAVNWALNECKKPGVDPAKYFLSMEQYRNVIDAELMTFARTPQNGKYLCGKSPMEAWLDGVGGHPGIKERPLRQLPYASRYKLATHARKVQVTGQGITFQVGGRRLVFWGDELLPYKGMTLSARWNLEEPSLLHLLPEGAEPFTVREKMLPSCTASPGELRSTEGEKRRWKQQGKAIHDNLPHPIVSQIVRDSESSPADVERTESIAKAAAKIGQERQAEKQAQTKRKRYNLPPEMTPRKTDRAAEAMKLLQDGNY